MDEKTEILRSYMTSNHSTFIVLFVGQTLFYLLGLQHRESQRRSLIECVLLLKELRRKASNRYTRISDNNQYSVIESQEEGH